MVMTLFYLVTGGLFYFLFIKPPFQKAHVEKEETLIYKETGLLKKIGKLKKKPAKSNA
ncbi:hypothetical protein QYG89_11220 [Bacillus sp. B190/17]|uniref:Uncharacterized protein n=1 Tax=Bacillus lumedeiriae TaxID=3058829 RepID=A0ABW8IAQ6_9BACI